MNRDDIEKILGFRPSDEQWSAISAPLDSPLLVLAGAGSGKTAVMSARVLWLVGSGQVDADQVLGLTFTNKAAAELSSRVRSLLDWLPAGDSDAGQPTIATFHSFAIDLLAEFGLLVGAEPSASLLSPTDLAVATYRVIANSSLACDQLGTSHLPTLRSRIQSLDEQLSEHLVEPQRLREHDEAFRAMLATQKDTAVCREMVQAATRRIIASAVVEEVREARRSDGVVGFADLMRHAAQISAIPRVREELRSRFLAVLVDEYQDTSVAQARMLRNLFGDGHPITSVGDPLQAIYGWRGASVANIDGFGEQFGAPTESLSINRRSGSLILDVANAAASEVRAQHPGVKVLRPGDERRGRVQAALFGSWDDEARWLVAQIAARIESGRAPDDIAVLCRTNAYVEDMAIRLRTAGIPVAAASLGSLLNLPEVTEVLSVMRVLSNGDNAALVRLLTGPQWRIGPSDLAVLGARAQYLASGEDTPDPETFDERLLDAVAATDPVEVVRLLEAVHDPGPRISDEARERLAQFVAQLDAIRPSVAGGAAEVAHRIVEVTGLAVEVRLGASADSRMDCLATLFDLIEDYRRGHDDPSLYAFLAWLDRAEELEAMPDSELPVRGRAVQIMTAHRAKGLEWDVVFVPALTDGVFPSSKGRSMWTRNFGELPYPLRGDSSRLPVLAGWSASGGQFTKSITAVDNELRSQYREYDAWEENRLAYVALTRAREELLASGHWWTKDVVERQPSKYLNIIREVPGVQVGPWVDQVPPKPLGLLAGDVAWPRPDEVYLHLDEMAVAADRLTEQEKSRLADLDSDIAAVTEREDELSQPLQYIDLPVVLSTSSLMRIAADPQAFALDLARPMPRIHSESALRGTAFHEWVARSHEQLTLIPEWDFAMDADLVDDDELAQLIEGYRSTPYSDMIPAETEIEVTVQIAGTVVRGIIDAVFRDEDGTWEVVDWKTNRNQNADPLQLAVYRLGWAQKVGVDPQEVRTAFVYVRDGQVVRPDLPELAELQRRLANLQ